MQLQRDKTRRRRAVVQSQEQEQQVLLFFLHLAMSQRRRLWGPPHERTPLEGSHEGQSKGEWEVQEQVEEMQVTERDKCSCGRDWRARKPFRRAFPDA